MFEGKHDIVDLRSDTVTQPTEAMRQAAYDAEVGDDGYRDDPSVNRLEELAAEILGKEEALFVPSGTMGNQLAIMSQTGRGDEIIIGNTCHILLNEVGATAVLSGVNVFPVPFPGGIPEADMVRRSIRSDGPAFPKTSLICLENPSFYGRVIPMENTKAVYRLAKERGIRVHLDGARLFNAAAALNVDVREITRYCDTVGCCLSKGLCAPVGAVLAGPRDTMALARRNRRILGGAMREAGILAAPGILALTEMPRRLHEDHENARYLADRLEEIPGIKVERELLDINMVYCRIDRPQPVLDGLKAGMMAEGIKINPQKDDGLFRFVTHKDINRQDIDFACGALKKLLA